MDSSWLRAYGPDDLLIDGAEAIVTADALGRMDHYAASEPTDPSPGRVWRSTRNYDFVEGREFLRWVEADPEPGYVLTHTVEAFVIDAPSIGAQCDTGEGA